MDLSARKELILSAIIERFITTGEPVGSKFLVEMLKMPVSSATVRNEMAYLSEMGYLSQPHTSAGRIPSDKGYRYYIDKLLMNFSPSDADMFTVLSSIDRSQGDINSILAQICEVLANITGLAAVAVTPGSEDFTIKGTQLLPLSKKTAMIVVRSSSGVTKNRISKLDCEIDYSLIDLFHNVTAANFTDIDPSEFTVARLQSVAASLGERSIDIMPLLVAFFESSLEAAGSEVIVSGYSNLLKIEELSSTALEITELLRNKTAALSLMETQKDSRVELRIGTENDFPCMKTAAVIKAPYKAGNAAYGSIGVIGPTNTDYSRVVPLVKYISETAGNILAEVTEN